MPCKSSVGGEHQVQPTEIPLSKMRFLSVLFLLEMSAQHIILPVISIDKRDNDSIVIFFSQNGRIHFLKKVCKHIYKSVKSINAGSLYFY